VETVVFAEGRSRLVVVGFRVNDVGLVLLAADAAVGAAAEADTRLGLGLISGDVGLGSFFTLFVLGEEGPWRAVVGLGVLSEDRLGSLGSVGDLFSCSGETPFLAGSATARGFGAEPLVVGLSVLGDRDALGVLGEVGDFVEDFENGTCLVGGGLIGCALLVVLSFVGGGG
jgi:hypothetical protein